MARFKVKATIEIEVDAPDEAAAEYGAHNLLRCQLRDKRVYGTDNISTKMRGDVKILDIHKEA